MLEEGERVRGRINLLRIKADLLNFFKIFLIKSGYPIYSIGKSDADNLKIMNF